MGNELEHKVVVADVEDENFPTDLLTRLPDGRLRFLSIHGLHGDPGPYQRVGFFPELGGLRGACEAEAVEGRMGGVRELAKEGNVATELVHGMSALANRFLPKKEGEKPSREYRMLFSAMFTALMSETLTENLVKTWEKNGGEEIALVAPLRGGQIIIEMVQARLAKTNPDLLAKLVVTDIEAHRVIAGDMYSVGMRENLPVASLPNDVFFVDDCLAGAGHSVVIADWIHSKNEDARVQMMFGVAARQSVVALQEYLRQDNRLQLTGMTVGATVGGLNENFYLGNTKGDRGRLKLRKTDVKTVGDMGDAMSLADTVGKDIVLKVVKRVATGELTTERILQIMGAVESGELALSEVGLLLSL